MKTAYCQLSSWDEIKAKILFELPESSLRVQCKQSQNSGLIDALDELAEKKGYKDFDIGFFIDEALVNYANSQPNELAMYCSQINSEVQWNEIVEFFQELCVTLNCEFSFFQGKSEVPVVKLSAVSVSYDTSQLQDFIGEIEVVNALFKQELFQACLSKEDLLEFERKLYLNKVSNRKSICFFTI